MMPTQVVVALQAAPEGSNQSRLSDNHLVIRKSADGDLIASIDVMSIMALMDTSN